MKEDVEFGYKVRQILNHGTDTLDQKVALRLYRARQHALAEQPVVVSARSLAGAGMVTGNRLSSQVSGLLAAMALSIGVVGTYYWNLYEKVSENEEIDSELLADELPPSIYLDRGFQAWLDRDSPSDLP